MKVKVFSFSEKGFEDNDCRSFLKITIDDKTVFDVSDGEPEDANLCRDFNGCWSIPSFIRKAHGAGLNGEPLEIEYIEIDSWDDMP